MNNYNMMKLVVRMKLVVLSKQYVKNYQILQVKTFLILIVAFSAAVLNLFDVMDHFSLRLCFGAHFMKKLF